MQTIQVRTDNFTLCGLMVNDVLATIVDSRSEAMECMYVVEPRGSNLDACNKIGAGEMNF